MRYTSFLPAVVAAALFAALSLAPARALDLPLKAFKNDLFSDQPIIEVSDDGALVVIDYKKQRDLYGRDTVPEKRVREAYVSTLVSRHQAEETLSLGDHRVAFTRVGPKRRAAFSVIFIHGRGGDRTLGVNDYTFGGNFNRLKNLVVQNGGSYYSPTIRDFGAGGIDAIGRLIGEVSERDRGRPVILACASMGSFICWGVARDAGVVSHLAGLAILGGASDLDFSRSIAYRRRVPVYFTHGGDDPVYPANEQIAFFRSLHETGYPTRLTLFATGSHGTPIRMTDWWRLLNWMLAQGR
ncbi:phospholipase [Breoghania corrubedonensis]|nr:phospholipase [Breoghania corrubedonensis]